MKIRILRIIFLLSIVGIVFHFNGGLEYLTKSKTVQAFGDLIVDFHVPVNIPIFSLFNMKPGDTESRPVDVVNNATSSKLVLTKGIRTGGVGLDPKLETVLDVVIKDGVNPIYGNGSPTGPKTLLNFLSESTGEGIPLNILVNGEDKTYNFEVNFPISAGNEYQAKSVIVKLVFNSKKIGDLVIQEVFYNVDDRHGYWDPKDKDEKDEEEYERRHGIRDKWRYDKKRKTRIRFQWIELYNPTGHDIDLKNWRITNESGQTITIQSNKKIKAHGFALLSKDSSLWKYWNIPRNVVKIEVGHYLGNGLDIDGDRLILSNPDGGEVDRMSWGTNTSGFTPFAVNPKVSKGHSTERKADGFDTNTAFDWIDMSFPTPGK